MPPIKTLVLDSFLLRTVDIAEVDPRQLHALSVGVRWPHRVPDWRTLIAAGRGIAAVDEIGRAVGSAMWFPYSDGFATIGMVITSPRLQAHGAGRWLMDEVLAAAGPRAFGLNATREAHRLYQSLGFVDGTTLYQRQGRAVPPEDTALPPGGTLRAAEPADLDALVRLDARAFGAPRPALLAHLLAAGNGTVLVRAGRIEAYALSRAVRPRAGRRPARRRVRRGRDRGRPAPRRGAGRAVPARGHPAGGRPVRGVPGPVGPQGVRHPDDDVPRPVLAGPGAGRAGHLRAGEPSPELRVSSPARREGESGRFDSMMSS